MKEMPSIRQLAEGGTIWTNRFESFSAKVYVPKTTLEVKVLNYGFIAPYLLVFEEESMTEEKAICYARESGLEALAAKYGTSVVFIGDYRGEKEEQVLAEIYTNSRIHQYYKDGAVIAKNRFTHQIEDYFIRGAIFRTCLFGTGKAADYIATHCLKHFQGDGLWGKADCAPALCVLEKLSVMPVVEADDIPIVSVQNTAETDEFLEKKATYFKKQERLDVMDLYENFGKQFRRMLGELELDPDLEKQGMVVEPGICMLKTSKDNEGDDAGTTEHEVGYFAFYNEALLKQEKVPLLLCFHGGGDSAFYISYVSGWARVAHRNDFLLVSVENHLNSTATEMIALIEKLKEKYPIDETRIYASGFSMGGCKTWDLIQEYPNVLAAAAPMDATFDVGQNVYGAKVQGGINESVAVPVFYTGGEITPLPELPFQEPKCFNRMKYVFDINRTKKECNISFEEQEAWENKIWGINGDRRLVFHDDSRNADLILELFDSEDGRCMTAFGSVSGQGHECREHTCECAWQFMKNFVRNEEGDTKGDARLGGF